MAGIVQFRDGLADGIFQGNNYFQVEYPGGKKTLWRLNKPSEGLMWGPPTKEKLVLEGKKGYDNFFDLADKQVTKEYSFPEVFSNVQACGSRKTYEICSEDDWIKAIKEVKELYYEHLNDKNLQPYFLVSRCVSISSRSADFYVFFVRSGSVYAYHLYNLNGNTSSPGFAVRPEATLKSTIPIKIDGCDGSKKKPYILLSRATSYKR